MANELMPWEVPPAPAVRSTEETLSALQRDVAYMVSHTAVIVHSSHELLRCVVNTPRGQIIPRGECKFTDGGTFELQDLGMPQVGAPLVSVPDLLTRVWEVARELGLELQS